MSNPQFSKTFLRFHGKAFFRLTDDTQDEKFQDQCNPKGGPNFHSLKWTLRDLPKVTKLIFVRLFLMGSVAENCDHASARSRIIIRLDMLCHESVTKSDA